MTIRSRSSLETQLKSQQQLLCSSKTIAIIAETSRKKPDLLKLYENTLVTDLEKSYAQPAVFTKEVPSRLWYLPHHEIVSPNKPKKVRRVSNAASKFKGQSLTSNLLTGADLLANLTGVLLRFRKFGIATLADNEEMFMQISIKAEDRFSLRFLCNRNNFIGHYQFSGLIFGATCSPFCAIYVLQKCAKDNIANFPPAFESVKTIFYRDDYIHSTSSPNEALESAFQTKAALQKGGFRLTKFESNSTKVLNGLPASEKETAKPTSTVLGQKWNLTTDELYMEPPKVIIGDAHKYTQRKFFSLVSSNFDPLGILASLIILIKTILQSTWKLGNSWD